MKITRRADRIWGPPPALTISEWADRERILSPESAAQPGKWLTAKTEYLREIMDCVGDARTQRIVCLKSIQVGWTECLGNVVGYFICEDPCPILVIQPTVEAAESWSKERLGP